MSCHFLNFRWRQYIKSICSVAAEHVITYLVLSCYMSPFWYSTRGWSPGFVQKSSSTVDSPTCYSSFHWYFNKLHIVIKQEVQTAHHMVITGLIHKCIRTDVHTHMDFKKLYKSSINITIYNLAWINMTPVAFLFPHVKLRLSNPQQMVMQPIQSSLLTSRFHTQARPQVFNFILLLLYLLLTFCD